jgi:hypothetical protein
MRHLQLVVDHDPAPTDFPPTWHEFEAARRRFFARLATEAVPTGRRDPLEAEALKEAPRL